MSEHESYMKLALDNAKAMKGQTAPNPLVGAVIVNDNRIVGVGAHLKAGEHHAEIHALRMAGEKAKGGTIYVTLEPCSHHGRTGPCAEALVTAGIKKVIIATLDPNPIVAGNGVRILEKANIEVIVGVCEEESRKMNEVFNKFIVKKQPFMTLKAATTLDGKISSHTWDSKWITSEEARLDVHHLRNEHSGILVGVHTVIQDDPELTTRIPYGRNPIRIILDSTLRIPLESKIVTDKKAETWVFTSKNHNHKIKQELENLGVKVFVTKGKQRVDLHDTMNILGEHNVSSVLIEGGGEVNSSFLKEQLVDKLVLYVAPKLIGGKQSPSFFAGEGIEKMSDAIDLEELDVTKIGKDFKYTGYPTYKNLK
ncbi:bifunctional diaminohydroxyphosphoribosylaminopyrimidine deaminase/5-amino-6-(5-phosphoribosylamino)uracil reductase RibD [Metabacillus litoralis]|uniref:Riboflavin biosynthesis protein RibD n=1 Tax=Metabacillus litoralis TaxID=152268 RepID=A0A5C6VB67_9BACI|nr:bifunctional diaminohydroxyphosphoribosylaminopyrimidine deaminase/5-amino-6-(5-phosphoribosylamino)uracil reductase RibD [Metabacillus litoralis]TXC81851.1 bifunctional diaminohydroxyphosphoribosylaminopyrimidine deaminase/5-amino-6-(5-phosphoribosylamino)uracil reductase RibD [Metabacillus litoralis]